MPAEPSGVNVFTPKVRDESLVRKFLSLGGTGYVAISIQDGSGPQAQPVDPDPGSLSLTLWFNDVLTTPAIDPTHPYGTQMQLITADSIIRSDTGKYYYSIGPALTQNRGLITAVWNYQINGVAFTFTDHLQVLDPMPLYDSLSDQDKTTVEQVTWFFGDMYDSTEGGPHLIEEFQTKWNYERIAQMMSIAVMRMNYLGNYGNPPTTWSIGDTASTGYTTDGQTITVTQTFMSGASTSTTFTTPSSTTGGSGSVPSNMQGLVVIGTYIECMRHFRDSYTELPARPGMDVTYTDRRDYWNRWQANLQAELQTWEQQVKLAKRSLLGLSRGALLVAGGIYGGSALGIFQAGTYASQVRSWRFYPAAPAIMFGATRH
jgi:hypothetical protein